MPSSTDRPATPTPDVDVDVVETTGDPVSYRGRRATKLRPSSREIKMLRPHCDVCAERVGGKKYLPPAWQDECEHDPYTHVAERPVTKPVYEDLDDGRKRVTGQETIVEYEVVPNWVSITHAGGVNKGRGVERALRRGYIYPQMLRSPAWPTGIKRRCQFRECFAEDLQRYSNGWFCRPEEAGLVRISDSSETYQVNFDERSRQFQEDQIQAAVARVGAPR